MSPSGNTLCISPVDHLDRVASTVRVIPFVLILFILLFGAAAAIETYTAPSDVTAATAVRPTVTPRPRPTSPRAVETPASTQAAPVADAAAAPQPPAATPAPSAPAPTATPGSKGQMKVGNTGGDGVFIRRTPNLNDKIRPWQDGTTMVVEGTPEAVNGIVWLKVRAPDGAEGYIPQQYLVP